jgi:hypothetical protein
MTRQRRPPDPPTNPPPRPRGRPIHPIHSGHIPNVSEDENQRDKIARVPAGGGYRILRRPRLLDSEE